jgi:hypothetical protein
MTTEQHRDRNGGFPTATPPGARRSPAEGSDPAGGGQCQADWRRPDGYWRCDRELGHKGRHNLRASLSPEPVVLPRPAARAGAGPEASYN